MAKLSKNIGINDHFIHLIDNKRPPYGLIYSPGLVELETLKTYIEINLANGFIKPFKSSADTPIQFIRKKDSSFWMCIDYWGFNNLTIHNQYLLPLIS